MKLKGLNTQIIRISKMIRARAMRILTDPGQKQFGSS